MGITFIPPASNQADRVRIKDVDNHFESGTVEGALKELAENGGSGSSVDIVDNLTSTDKNKALSANQGKVLNEQYQQIANDLNEHKTNHPSGEIGDVISTNNNYLFDFSSEKRLALNDFSGYNQSYHPSVVYVPNKFAGYKYWMVTTPYPIGGQPYRDRWECPCVYKSNNGIEWINAENANPLDDLTESEIANKDYFSDPHLVYREDINTLECWYRLTHFEKETELNMQSPTMLVRKKTIDGSSWTSREVLVEYKDNRVNDFIRSPSVIWDNKNKMYKMWKNATGGLYYLYSFNAKDWSQQVSVNIIGMDTSWHSDVNYYNNIYNLINYDRPNDRIEHYTSVDGINFSLNRIILNSGDSIYTQHLYRAVSLIDEFGNVRIYFTCESENKAGIGLMVGTDFENLSIVNGESIIENGKTNSIFLDNISDGYGKNLREILDDIYSVLNCGDVVNTIITNVNSIEMHKGTGFNLKVKLKEQPTKNIAISVNSDNVNVITNKNELIFTNDNYNVEQVIEIKASSTADGKCSLKLSGNNVNDKNISIVLLEGETPPSSYLWCDVDFTKDLVNSKAMDSIENMNFVANNTSKDVDNSLSLNGENSYLSGDNANYKDIITSSEFTMIIKVKCSAANTNSINGIFDMCKNQNVGFGCVFRSSDPYLRTISALVYDDTSTSSYYDDICHVIAISKNGLTAKVFIDGSLKHTGNFSTIITYYKDNMDLGCYKTGSSTVNYFKGNFYNFKLYNKDLGDSNIVNISNELLT